MPHKLIAAIERAEFVHCAMAWELKYVRGAESSAEAPQLQVEGNAWHAAPGGDSHEAAVSNSLLSLLWRPRSTGRESGVH